MRILFYIFISSLINTNSIIPTWNLQTSVIDLLDGEDSFSYTIDNRNNFYESSDLLSKTIKWENGKIIHENTFKMYDLGWSNEKFSNKVEFEAIDGIYSDTHDKTEIPLVCPRGNYFPFKITSKSEMRELEHGDPEWIKNEKFELKCYFHRGNGGHFLVFYLMNGKNYLLELLSTNFRDANEYYFDVDEIYDFKLLNKKDFDCNDTNPYPFIGLVKKDNNLRLIGTKLNLNLFSSSQNIEDYKDLFKLKKNTRAYFHVYDYNNDFYYFTYNNIFDFLSGYSTKSIPTTDSPDYNDISQVTFVNNEKSPFEFLNEVEILQMENMFNYKYVYYKIKDKVTNIIYHGILDIVFNKIVFNTDEEIEQFIPYITFIDTDKGGYQHSNSMLMITKNSAYRVCAIKDNFDCLEKCPSGQKIMFDVDGNKCVALDKNCDEGKLMLIPENICISECDNSTIYINNETHCGLCRDMDEMKKYKFIYGSKCLSEIPEGAIIYNKNFSLLICDEGYTLKDNECEKNCYITCKTCFNKSYNPNEQKCESCIDGYYLVDNITYNCEPIPITTIPIIQSTIPIITIPSTFFNIPTTHPIIPSTLLIQTTFLIIPSTIPIIPTTNIIIPTTMITTIPTTIITTALEIFPEPTTIPIKIPSTPKETIYNNCTYHYYLTNNCSFENLNNSEILSKLKNEMLRTYPNNGINVEIKALSGYAFQLTNSLNQLDFKYSSFSKINLKECEKNLKEHYGLEQNISLIFFKFENIESAKNERKIQYEIYNPLNYEKLNISICENTKIQIIISFRLSNDLKEMIKNILNQDYDPFDEKGKFYNEICMPYKSENKTDVVLEDRKKYLHRRILNEISCPSGCEMSSYSLDDEYIICECDINNKAIIGKDFHYLNEKKNENVFLSIFKNSFFKVMRCYNLVFSLKIFFHNYLSIITIIFFVVYVVILYFSIISITSLNKRFNKLIFDKKKINSKTMHNNTQSGKNRKASNENKFSKKGKESYPPKRRHSTTRRIKPNNIDKEKNENQLRIMDIDNEHIQHMETISKNRDKRKFNSYRVRKKITIDENQFDMYVKTKAQLVNKNVYLEYSEEKMNKEELKEEYINKKDKHNYKYLDDYELNNMVYKDAREYDKRNCIMTYWSFLKREHFFIITFYTRKDHNLFYIKFERFLMLICTEIAMNGMFFVHETMYIKQNGGARFVHKIPQIIFSLLVSYIIDIIICYLSMTDVAYYKIKILSIKEENDGKINNILKCMKIKLIGFFIFTFILFLFYLYYISSFCAVYQNTQLLYLRDSVISILISFIVPFIIYGILCLLRILSLSKRGKKKMLCIYKLSHIFPLF